MGIEKLVDLALALGLLFIAASALFFLWHIMLVGIRKIADTIRRKSQ